MFVLVMLGTCETTSRGGYVFVDLNFVEGKLEIWAIFGWILEDL